MDSGQPKEMDEKIRLRDWLITAWLCDFPFIQIQNLSK